MKRKPSLPALLRWAIGYVDRMNVELRVAHLSPRSGRLEPASVEREYESVERWLRKARRAVDPPANAPKKKAARKAK